MPVISSDAGRVRYVTPSWHPVYSSLTISSNGKLHADNFILGYGAGAGSHGLLIMNGGTLKTGNLWVGHDGKGEIQLQSGSIEALTITWGQESGQGTGQINIQSGILFIPGDARSLIEQYHQKGYIRAYNGSGRLKVDYGIIKVGYTTVSASMDIKKAWQPNPSNDQFFLADEVDSITLTWTAGFQAVSHHLYFGTDPIQVSQATVNTPVIYQGLLLDPMFFIPDLKSGTTYYWRVDEVDSQGQITQGDLWRFHTGFPMVDLESDTWVAVDGLDRTLPGRQECGSPREDRIVGIYYVVWHGHHGSDGPHNITEMIAANPANPNFPIGQIVWWDQPEAGYFFATDEWMIRRNLSMLTDAGVDVLIVESTNGIPYVQETITLLNTLNKMKSEGFKTPLKFCFWTHAYSPSVVKTYHEAFYSKGLYKDLWFYWDGKPLMLGYPDGLSSDVPQTSVSDEIRNFFTWRECWAWDHGQYKWQFVDTSPQDWAWSTSSDRPEQVVIQTASHPTNNIGKSNVNNTQPPINQYDLPVAGTEGHGLHFAEQWRRAFHLDPEFLFFTEWNEWLHSVWIRNESDPPIKFVGRDVPVGGIYLVDQYNREFTRDIEPMKGGYTDNYYFQMVDMIRRYKGVNPAPQAGGARSIQIDGKFEDWLQVSPTYHDTPGDVFHRDFPGFGNAQLVNLTGRNDFVSMKVARDENHIYFLAENRKPITSPNDPNWMWLFIDTDQNHSTGWEGYDVLVNKGPIGNHLTTLHSSSTGWDWKLVSDQIQFWCEGTQMELRIPRNLLNQGSGDQPVAFNFHWADNIQKEDDIIEFAVSGDSAPNRRFNYQYKTGNNQEVILIDENFDSPGTTPWGDWDLSTRQSYSGSQSLECSADDNNGLIVGFNTQGLSSFHVTYRFKLQNVRDSHNVTFWFHDGTQWNQINEIGLNTNNVWLYYTDVRHNSGNDTRYFNTNVTFHIQGQGLTTSNQFIWLDDVRIIGTKENQAASNPIPTDGAKDVPHEITLGWTAGVAGTPYEVYFGTESDPPLYETVQGRETVELPSLEEETTYYWRVDERVQVDLFIPGPVWSFTTGKKEVVLPKWRLY